jgi:diadenosine tetraphosphate (Ap4A) HIT family hydrolase
VGETLKSLRRAQNTDCLVCRTLRGAVTPPGGVICEDQHWLVDHTLPPVFIRGQLILKLKRHCEHLAELTPAESLALGPLIRRVCAAFQAETNAEKVHVASYGEGIGHIHFLITPRTKKLPASNLRMAFWLAGRRFCHRVGFKRLASSPEETAAIARQISQRLAVNQENR